VRDGVALPYVAAIAAYLLLMTGLLPATGAGAAHTVGAGRWRLAAAAALGGAVLLHVLRDQAPAPRRYPWLWDRAFISYGFVFVAAGMAYTNYRQWHQQQAPARVAPGRKHA
jgi:hypothetical protein